MSGGPSVTREARELRRLLENMGGAGSKNHHVGAALAELDSLVAALVAATARAEEAEEAAMEWVREVDAAHAAMTHWLGEANRAEACAAELEARLKEEAAAKWSARKGRQEADSRAAELEAALTDFIIASGTPEYVRAFNLAMAVGRARSVLARGGVSEPGKQADTSFGAAPPRTTAAPGSLTPPDAVGRGQ